MNRNDIIKSLLKCSDADSDRLSDRFRNCNIRIVRVDGSAELANHIRTRIQAAQAMQTDPTIAEFQYCFNNEWHAAYTA